MCLLEMHERLYPPSESCFPQSMWTPMRLTSLKSLANGHYEMFLLVGLRAVRPGSYDIAHAERATLSL